MPAGEITFDAASASAELSGQSSRTWSHTVGSGNNRILLVSIMVRDTSMTVGRGAATSVVYGSTPLSLVASHAPTDSDIGYLTVQLWELRNPPVGTNNVTVTWAGNIARGGCGAVSLFGVNLNAPYVGSPVYADSDGDYGSDPSLSVTATAAGQWALDVVYNMASSQSPTESGQIARVNELYGNGSFFDNGGISTREASAAGSVAMGWTHPDFGYWAQLGVVLQPAANDDIFLGADAGEFRFSGAAVRLSAQRRIFADAGGLQFSGADAALNVTRRLSVDAGEYRFSGGAVGLPLRRVVQADAGQFRFGGGAVSLEVDRRVAIDAAEFRFQGAAVGFSIGYRLGADTGVFRFAGGALNFGASRQIGADAGDFRFVGGEITFSVTGDQMLDVDAGELRFSGGTVSLRASRRINVDAGALGFTGAEVEPLAARRLRVEPGDYRINGMALNLVANTTTTLGADSGAFVFSGAGVALRVIRRLRADAGDIRMGGSDVDLSRDRVLRAEPGRFRISGLRARLRYSGEPPVTGADRGGVASGVSESIVERIVA
jgi:hypothetical protein